MAQQPDPLSSAVHEAKLAIERGNYARAVEVLEPLCEIHSPVQPPGDMLRLLLATALMGQGQGEKAAACCRSLQACANPQRRSQAKELLLVLEAPALKRPRNWSLTLPRLEEAPPLQGVAAGRGSARRQAKETPPPPPVGPTRNPLGFAAVVVLLLVALLLSSLLSGCMRVETQLDFAGPGRVHLQHRLQSTSGTVLPFQQRLAIALATSDPPYRIEQRGPTTLLQSPLLSPEIAMASLRQTLAQASALAGFSLPPPLLHWQETNWLLGVDQQIQIALDLQAIPSLPGLDLQLRLTPLALRAIRTAQPLPVQSAQGGSAALIWPLQPGATNTLAIHCWRWSPLGLGGLAISFALLLVVLLQRMRVRLGMGLPELPG